MFILSSQNVLSPVSIFLSDAYEIVQHTHIQEVTCARARARKLTCIYRQTHASTPAPTGTCTQRPIHTHAITQAHAQWQSQLQYCLFPSNL